MQFLVASVYVQPLSFEGPDRFFLFSRLHQPAMAIIYGFIFHFAACQHTAGSAVNCLIPSVLHYFASAPRRRPSRLQMKSASPRLCLDYYQNLPHSYAQAAFLCPRPLFAQITEEGAYLTEQFSLEL